MKQPKSYYDFKSCKTRIQVHQGGSRSGKTYSILQGIAELCHLNKNAGLVITITRATLPSLKASAMRDFFEIIQGEGWYDERVHNKSDHIYLLFGNLVEFVSADQPQKIRGRKRHILYANEGNELTLEQWRQFMMRTTWKAIIDFNPSDEFHWIYDEVLTRDDCTFYQSTYLDNPFLDAEVIREIERLKDADENYWRVYGLGERGVSRSLVYNHWKQVTEVPEGYKLTTVGVDFGFTNNPTAIGGVYTDGHGTFFDLWAYATGMNNADIARTIQTKLTELQESSRTLVVADSAEPKSISEIRGWGVNITPSQKGADSVRIGIQYLLARPMYVRGDEVVKELKSYKYMTDRNGIITNEVQKDNDHALDAWRYAATHNKLKPNYGKYAIG